MPQEGNKLISRSVAMPKESWEEATRICGMIQSQTGKRMSVSRFIGEIIEKGIKDYDIKQHKPST